MKTHFTGEFHARRPITIAVGLVLTSIGLCFAGMWTPQMGRQMTVTHMLGTVCASLFIITFLCGGLFLLHKAAKNHKTVLKITSYGISYGSKTYRWEDITEIGIMQKYTGRNDLYCTTRLHPYTIELLLSSGLGSEQVATLFETLRSEVLSLHPHVSFPENHVEKG